MLVLKSVAWWNNQKHRLKFRIKRRTFKMIEENPFHNYPYTPSPDDATGFSQVCGEWSCVVLPRVPVCIFGRAHHVWLNGAVARRRRNSGIFGIGDQYVCSSTCCSILIGCMPRRVSSVPLWSQTSNTVYFNALRACESSVFNSRTRSRRWYRSASVTSIRWIAKLIVELSSSRYSDIWKHSG